jgi:UDP-GlcNAc:undecaprenyl-phosphate GlcNAc-1-phosphate transferase
LRTFLVAFLLAFGVSASLTPLVRRWATRLGGLDRAGSSRKVHTQPIPRVGGIAVVLGFVVPLLGLFFWENDVSTLFFAHPNRVLGLFVGGVAIALLGLYDDVRGANARVKFAAQGIVAIVMYPLGYAVHVVANPFGDPVQLGLLSGPLTVLWIVGIINALNLIDGLDGLAAGVAVIVVMLTFAVALGRLDVLMCLFMASLAGAVLGFLLYNWNPASIFMGDTGSMFLGFVLGVSTVATNQKSSTAVAILVPIVALGLPIADTLLAMLRRAALGRPIFAADREHIHHRLFDLGLSHRQTVLVLYAVCVFLALVAFSLTYVNSSDVALLLAMAGSLAFLGLRRLGYLHVSRETFRQSLIARERNHELRRALRGVSERLERAAHLEGLFQALPPVVPALGADAVTVWLAVAPGVSETREITAMSRLATAAAPRAPLTVQMPIQVRAARDTGGSLEVTWRTHAGAIDRDSEIFLERLVRHLETALARIHKRPFGPLAAPGASLEQKHGAAVAAVLRDAS